MAEFGQHARVVAPKRLAVAYRERIEGARALYANVS